MLHTRDSRPQNSAGCRIFSLDLSLMTNAARFSDHPERLCLTALLAVAAYFGLCGWLRLWVSPTLELDQAEQALLSQQLAWGYTEQPPLYTWLAWAGFALFGLSPAVLSGLKAMTLSGTAAGLLFAASRLGFPRGHQWAVLVGLVFIPQFIWESQRDVTHSCLASTGAAWALGLMVAARSARRREPWLIAAGALLGVAILGKYNSSLLLPAAALILHGPGPERLPLKLAPWWLCALALCLLPHGLWAPTHAELQQRGLAKLADPAASPWAALLITDLNTLAFATPLWLFALLNHNQALSPWQQRQLHRGRALFGIVLITVALLVVLGETRGFKDRWFQPLLTWVVLWFAAGVRLDSRVYRFTQVIALALALLVAIALNARILWAEALDEAIRPNLPYATLAEALENAAGATPEVILAERKLLGGNLRMHFGKSWVLTPEVGAALPRPQAARYLVVCETERCDKPGFRDWLGGMGVTLPDTAGQERLSAPLRYHRQQAHSIAYMWVRAGEPPVE